MLKLSLVGVALIAITIVIHAIGTIRWGRVVLRRFGAANTGKTGPGIYMLTQTALVLVGLHIIEILLWTLTYRAIVPADELATFEQALYFSVVTFTTLGYGDVTLSEGWRLLSGIEALNGILLVGWSTATLFVMVQRIWQDLKEQDKI